MTLTVHESPYRGSWYPDDAGALRRLLAEQWERSRRRKGPYVFPGGLAFVVPHAAPQYSGTVAAAAFRAIEESKPDRVVVLAFPHHGGLRGVAVADVETIGTPLGNIALDTTYAPFAPRLPERELCDHSFEIQLPFLACAAPGARISALYVGRMNAEERTAAADALAGAWRPGTVYLASSDFTHYGRDFGFAPFPADGATAARLHQLDFESIEAASSLDAELFLSTLDSTGSTVCGRAPVALLLETLRRLDSSGIYQATLDYQTSGEITGDYRHSVSYGALGYYPRASFDLNAADCEALLDSAAETLVRLRGSGRRETVPARGSVALEAGRDLFVSLHQDDELLGCMGRCFASTPLREAAAELTLSAALEDPRFQPAAETEGPIDLEISVLTPMRRIRQAEEFTVGRHGAFLRRGAHSGLLLPQVAERREWTAEEFLAAVARKSGLGGAAWRDPAARLFRFEAQVFSRPGLLARS